MRELWAVARHGFIEGVRSRLTALFVGLLIAAVIFVASISKGASFRDQMQTFLSYSVGITSVLLSLLTILLTCAVLCREVEKRYVFTSLTKPIARWKHIVGRWVGICLLQLMLVAAAGSAIYGTAHYMRYSAGVTDPNHPVNSEVLCARISHGASDLTERIDREMAKRVAELKQRRVYDNRVREVGQEAMDKSVRDYAVAKLESAVPGGKLSWRFDNLPRPAETGESVQFRLKVAADNALPLEELQRQLFFNNPQTGETLMLPVRFPVNASKAVDLPSWLINKDGSLEVTFVNAPPPGAASPIPSAVTINRNHVRLLYRVGGFTANFTRAMILVWLLQAFLAAMSLFVASWLSFAVACLWCITLYVLGHLANFVITAATETPVPDTVSVIGRYVTEAVMLTLPTFSKVDPNESLIGGVLIPWSYVGATALWFLLVWSAVPLLFASVIFTRRELARVIAE